MKDKNMDKWLRSKCPSITIDYINYNCVEGYSICVSCSIILNPSSRSGIQCTYVTKKYHCGFPEISDPLKSAFILLGRRE